MYHIYTANELKRKDRLGLSALRGARCTEDLAHIVFDNEIILKGILNHNCETLKYSMIGDPSKTLMLSRDDKGVIRNKARLFNTELEPNRYRYSVAGFEMGGHLSILVEDQISNQKQTLRFVLDPDSSNQSRPKSYNQTMRRYSDLSKTEESQPTISEETPVIRSGDSSYDDGRHKRVTREPNVGPIVSPKSRSPSTGQRIGSAFDQEANRGYSFKFGSDLHSKLNDLSFCGARSA